MKYHVFITLERVRQIQAGSIPTIDEHRDILRFAEDHLVAMENCTFEEIFEMLQWGPGTVMDETSFDTLKKFLAQVEDDIETQADLFHSAREQVILDLGGQKLLDTFRQEDERSFSIAVEKAMERYYTAIAERDAAIKKESK